MINGTLTVTPHPEDYPPNQTVLLKDLYRNKVIELLQHESINELKCIAENGTVLDVRAYSTDFGFYGKQGPKHASKYVWLINPITRQKLTYDESSFLVNNFKLNHSQN